MRILWLTNSSLCFNLAAPLLFRPTKRPQVSTQKSKPKSNLQAIGLPNAGKENSKPSSGGDSNSTTQAPVKSTLSDWAAALDDDDVNGFHAAEKRQRGGRKKRKKNKEVPVVQNWDDIYDPSRPNAYEEYLNSDEKILEIREWKDRLYAHRISQRRGNSKDTSSDDGGPVRRDRKLIRSPGRSGSSIDCCRSESVARPPFCPTSKLREQYICCPCCG